MKVPRLGVKSELQLPDHAKTTTSHDPRCVCNLHHSSRQCQILNPLSEAKDQTCILMDTSWVYYHQWEFPKMTAVKVKIISRGDFSLGWQSKGPPRTVEWSLSSPGCRACLSGLISWGVHLTDPPEGLMACLTELLCLVGTWMEELLGDKAKCCYVLTSL